MSDSWIPGGVQSVDPSVHKQGFGTVSYGADDALAVRFYWRPVELGAQSQAQGRPIYEKRVYVEIIAPSDTTTKSIVDREASDDDKRRFGRQYESFQRGEERAQIGTPLESWPLLDVAQIATMKALNIYSVDQLAAMSDTQLRPLEPHGFNLRTQAQAWLAQAKDGALATKQAKEMDDLRDELRRMRELVHSLGAAAPKKTKRPYNRKATPEPQVAA